MSSIFIDFRDTSGYVSDPAGATYCLGGLADTYPITRGGVTFGWTDGTNFGASADRDNTNIPQLAGINYIQNTPGILAPFRLDLTSLGGPGTYKIGAAFGDASGAQGIQIAAFMDGATTLFTVNGTTTGANDFVDATSVNRTNTTWLAGQAYQMVSIAGSSLTVVLGNAASGFTCISCLYVEFIPTATARPSMFIRHQTFPRRRGR
jgi:hypothetical protein